MPEIRKKSKQNLSNTLRLNFCFLKISHFLHPCYNRKIVEHIPKEYAKNLVRLFQSVLMNHMIKKKEEEEKKCV